MAFIIDTNCLQYRMLKMVFSYQEGNIFQEEDLVEKVLMFASCLASTAKLFFYNRYLIRQKRRQMNFHAKRICGPGILEKPKIGWKTFYIYGGVTGVHFSFDMLPSWTYSTCSYPGWKLDTRPEQYYQCFKKLSIYDQSSFATVSPCIRRTYWYLQSACTVLWERNKSQNCLSQTCQLHTGEVDSRRETWSARSRKGSQVGEQPQNKMRCFF